MGGIGLPELLIVLVIIMIIFGASKLPGIGSTLGNTVKSFKQSMKETSEDATEETVRSGPEIEAEDIKLISQGLEKRKSDEAPQESNKNDSPD